VRHALPFTPATNAWFEAVFPEPTPAQVLGWEAIAEGHHTLIHAPTGSGKTLAAFLWALDRLLTAPAPPPRQACRVLYISPLKALAYDVDRNLRAPLTGIRAEVAQTMVTMGLDLGSITTRATLQEGLEYAIS
jgi:ATP-dependent Lhr-like helicase